MCQKRPYPSQAKAKHQARKMRRWFGRQWAYRCPDCGQWHLTSQIRARRVSGIVRIDDLYIRSNSQ